MKGLYLNSILIIILSCCLSIGAVAQLQINTNTTADQMVEEFVGVGIEYFNASYLGADVAGGIFTMGGSAGLDVEHGIFLSSGNGNLIPGPNSSSAASQNNGLPGHPILTDMLGIQTYDAAVLEFDFKTMHDTLKFDFLFGSEEYNEYVGAPFNDIYGLFVTGPNPNPAGEFYDDENFGIIIDLEITPIDTTYIEADTTYIAADTLYIPADTLIMPPDTLIFPADTLYFPADTIYVVADTIISIPDTTFTPVPVYINNINNGPALPGEPSQGPCHFCEYFYDNINGGKNIEYDGITATINAKIPVQPDAMYHFIIVIADAGDGIFDSGVLMEGESFKSLGPAQFNSFAFLAENNEELNTDVNGQIIGNEVYLTVPDVVDISNLVANFQVGGVYVDINGIAQVSGLTPNNFLEPVSYHLEGYNTKDWKVYVETVSGLNRYLFNQVKIGPNPSIGEVYIDNISGFDVRIINAVGKAVRSYNSVVDKNLVITDLYPGIYFIQLRKESNLEVRKLIIQ